MNGAGAKAKGSGFERTVCKGLSLWVSKGQREDLFWRSAMSGGRATVAFKRGARLTATAGDISAIDPAGAILTNKFLVECKAYADFNFAGLIKGLGKLYEFWEVAKAEAGRHNRFPMLIGKENNFPIVLCVTGDGANCLSLTRATCRAHFPQLQMYLHLYDQVLAQPFKIAKSERVKLVEEAPARPRVRLL